MNGGMYSKEYRSAIKEGIKYAYSKLYEEEEMLSQLEQIGFALIIKKYRKLNKVVNKLENYFRSLDSKCFNMEKKRMMFHVPFNKAKYLSLERRANKAWRIWDKLKPQKEKLLETIEFISKDVLKLKYTEGSDRERFEQEFLQKRCEDIFKKKEAV